MYYIAVGCVSPQSGYIKKLCLKANKRKDCMGRPLASSMQSPRLGVVAA